MEKTRKTRNLQKSWNKKRPQDAESFAQFRRELRDFLRELGAEKAPKAHTGEETSAVSPPLLKILKAVVFTVVFTFTVGSYLS